MKYLESVEKGTEPFGEPAFNIFMVHGDSGNLGTKIYNILKFLESLNCLIPRGRLRKVEHRIYRKQASVP